MRKRNPCPNTINLDGTARQCTLGRGHKGFHAWGIRWGTITIRIGRKKK